MCKLCFIFFQTYNTRWSNTKHNNRPIDFGAYLRPMMTILNVWFRKFEIKSEARRLVATQWDFLNEKYQIFSTERASRATRDMNEWMNEWFDSHKWASPKWQTKKINQQIVHNCEMCVGASLTLKSCQLVSSSTWKEKEMKFKFKRLQFMTRWKR